MAALAYLVALVSLLTVERVPVFVGEDGDRGDGELVRGSKGANIQYIVPCRFRACGRQ